MYGYPYMHGLYVLYRLYQCIKWLGRWMPGRGLFIILYRHEGPESREFTYVRTIRYI